MIYFDALSEAKTQNIRMPSEQLSNEYRKIAQLTLPPNFDPKNQNQCNDLETQLDVALENFLTEIGSPLRASRDIPLTSSQINTRDNLIEVLDNLMKCGNKSWSERSDFEYFKLILQNTGPAPSSEASKHLNEARQLLNKNKGNILAGAGGAAGAYIVYRILKLLLLAYPPVGIPANLAP
jgi:exonuclease V gamma subunit